MMRRPVAMILTRVLVGLALLFSFGWAKADESTDAAARMSAIFSSSRDCRGVVYRNIGFCQGQDCKAVAMGTAGLCQTGDCRALVYRIFSYCESSDCRAVLMNNLGMCSTWNCRAILYNNPAYCRDGRVPPPDSEEVRE